MIKSFFFFLLYDYSTRKEKKQWERAEKKKKTEKKNRAKLKIFKTRAIVKPLACVIFVPLLIRSLGTPFCRLSVIFPFLFFSYPSCIRVISLARVTRTSPFFFCFLFRSSFLPFFFLLPFDRKKIYEMDEEGWAGKVRSYEYTVYVYLIRVNNLKLFPRSWCVYIRGGVNERKIVHTMCIDALQMHQHQQCRRTPSILRVCKYTV